MKDLTGLQIGRFYVIKKVFNPNVKTAQNKYWLVEVDGEQKLMRQDNILIHGNRPGRQLIPRKVTPKQIIQHYIQTNDDISLGAVMLCCSLDITNKLAELEKLNSKAFFVPLHKYIEEYMNTPRYQLCTQK